MSNEIEPEIAAQAYTSVKALAREPYDLIVVDGRPDSDTTSLDAARIARLNLIPTGTSADDLRPQILFARELMAKGVDDATILFVFNLTIGSKASLRIAQEAIAKAGFRYSTTDLPARTSYSNAQNIGAAVSETDHRSLNARAELLAAEIMAQAKEPGDTL